MLTGLMPRHRRPDIHPNLVARLPQGYRERKKLNHPLVALTVLRVSPAYLSRIVSIPPFLGPPDCGEALIRSIADRETLLQGPTSPSQANTIPPRGPSAFLTIH